jgi:hypothetical protein
MRFERISVFAVLAFALASGCSASRNAATSLREHDADESPETQVIVPPRHEHEFAPGTIPPKDEFHDPPQNSGPREPVPAPPAQGVSRVKSVSFLRDLSQKRRPTDECGENCSDEELIGRCSPIEPCVPSQDSAARIERYRSRVRGGDDPQRLNPMRSLKNSLGNIFHKPTASCAATDCASQIADREFPTHVPVPHSSAAGTGASAPTKAVEVPRNSADLQHHRRSGALARRLDLLDSDPGLIQPVEMVPNPVHASTTAEEETIAVPLNPAPPANSVPPAVPVESPAPATSIPQPDPGPSNQLVEPPLWPRLRGTALEPAHSVSQSVVLPLPPPAAQSGIQIVPRPRY